MVKNSPAKWETWVRSLGWEDPLEEGMATHSSILAWRFPWTEEPGRLVIEMFRPFPFNVTTDMVRHKFVILLFVFSLPSLFIVPLVLFFYFFLPPLE